MSIIYQRPIQPTAMQLSTTMQNVELGPFTTGCRAPTQSYIHHFDVTYRELYSVDLPPVMLNKII